MRIEIPSDCEKINILFSGGMDSSILTYLLAKEISIRNKNIPIFCFSFGDSFKKEAIINVTEFITNIFPNSITLTKLKGKKRIRDVTAMILDVNGGYVFSGCNKVVEDKFTPTNYIPEDTPPVRGPPFNERHIRPFIDMDKIEVLQIYLDENVLELLPLTHSCGLSRQERCGGCYFCLERKWAADSLNVIDM